MFMSITESAARESICAGYQWSCLCGHLRGRSSGGPLRPSSPPYR